MADRRTPDPAVVPRGRAAQAEPGRPPAAKVSRPAAGGGKTSSPPSVTEAGMPSPGPGECSQRGGTAPGPGTGQTPAGGGERAGELLPDRSRTFTIPLPPGLKLLSLNDRLHYGERYRRSEALKKAAWAVAIHRKVPRLERVSIVVEYQPRDRRHRDPDNIAASAKALIDGIRAAEVLPGDDSRHVTEVTCRIGEPYPLGRLVLHLTEVPS